MCWWRCCYLYAFHCQPFELFFGKKLAKNVPDVSAQPEVNPSIPSPGLSFQPFTKDFVTNSIKHLKPKKAIGLDKISARFLKDSFYVIVSSLTSLFNISLQTETFPSTWKNARVVPLFKKGDKQDPSNYRTISILPTLSKILKKSSPYPILLISTKI